MGKLTLRGF